ncbi:MAG TPA: translation initiation factor IF-2 [Bacteroidales bacterium]|nr:translation initiation factor IF-2 [Bacteroidales bacterium]
MEDGNKIMRLSKAAKEFNVGITTMVDFLKKKGFTIDSNPNAKITPAMFDVLEKEYQSEKSVKESSKKIEIEYIKHQSISLEDKKVVVEDVEEKEKEPQELFIKNVPFDYSDSFKHHEKKSEQPPVPEKEPEPEKTIPPVEVPVKEITDEIKPEETPQPEEVKPIEIQPVEPVLEPEPVVEIHEISLPEPEISIPEKVSEAKPESERIEETVLPEEPTPVQVKLVGFLDLDSLNPHKKTAHKSKAEKKKAKEDSEEETAKTEKESTEATKAETPAEVEPIIEITPEPIAQIPEPEVVVEPPVEEKISNFLPTERRILEGPTIVGTMKLPEPKKQEPKKPVASSSDEMMKAKKKKRKRIKKQHPGTEEAGKEHPKTEVSKDNKFKDKKTKKEIFKPEVSEDDIQKQIKETLQRLSSTGKSKASKHRRDKRHLISKQFEEEQHKIEEEKLVLKVTEFVTANELASMMNVQVTQVISTCLSLGLFVSINQRLDAETLVLVADEFGYKVEFVSIDVQEAIRGSEEIDKPEDLRPRTPIVTVMGHVDHGKTSLLDYIRHANVIAGEAGGITQHIGAYEVKLENGKRITFLDTPGHEAFTAMRARGAQVTDVAIIVIAADDTIMPQTIEAINHAHAANVPIVFAINKIDKANANPEKIKEELSKRDILVEDWGGKYQSQEISAKKGINVGLLLEKVLLEAEMLELKANPSRPAIGTVIESSLDKGRGYVAKLLVQNGTLKIGDIVLAGSCYGKVKAMYNERNQLIKEAGPSIPLLLLGLNGAPQAGDVFNVMSDEREVKAIATKRLQLQREQGIRTQKHITLDEIGRRIAIGDFKELNIIVKGDVDGSIEALSDSLLKLSTPEVQVNVIHKSVGQVTESDVLLASASNAIIIGFQVRPSLSARKLAEQEQIDIRLYSVIYNAINEIKDAIEGMLSPEMEEKITCNIEVRDVFKITKVGTIAGCIVLDGKVNRNTKVRVIRDGIVVYTGSLGSLKRFKDDVKEVATGYECGLNIDNFNDIKVNDIIEGYEIIEVKRKL